ncbi:serine/threonine-protein kinase [Planotetraspora sp. GP83]|uniref:serine/threonine-protein kinase n=1 Tax=Planotetraspora sp. GP83 TaxID=3156264 RepID=UPI0035178A47
MPEQQPRLLADRYELITPIGRGTMGTVWRAFDRSLGREVAVKEIRQDPTLSPPQRRELRERMIREGRIAARVSHPSVATIHDAIEVDGSPWIIMELVEGRSLEQVIDEEGPLPPRLVAEIGYDLLGALRAAHSQDILHRDVKPSNVLLTETGRVVLTDFGIAKAQGDSPLTQTGMVIGSPGYTAPERARGDHTGPESDMWSLGATLYFAVEGRPAYERGSVGETLAALMTETADPPTQAGPLRPVLDGLLQKDHTVRLTPERAAAMLRIIADTPAAAPAGASPQPAPPVNAPAKAAPAKAASAKAASTSAPAGPASPTDVFPVSGAATAGGASRVDGSSSEDAADQTMVIIRPKGGLRIPPPASSPSPSADGAIPAAPSAAADAPEAMSAPSGSEAPPGSEAPSGSEASDDDTDTTAPRRLPANRPHTTPPPAATAGAAAKQGRGEADSGQPEAHPGESGQPGHPASGDSGNGHRPGGLGTDLFAMQGSQEPDAGGRVRVLVLAVIALVAFLAVVVLAMVALGR